MTAKHQIIIDLQDAEIERLKAEIAWRDERIASLAQTVCAHKYLLARATAAIETALPSVRTGCNLAITGPFLIEELRKAAE